MMSFPLLPVGATKHTFELAGDEFLLDGKPFQIRSGEIHPERIAKEYWRHLTRCRCPGRWG